MLTQIDYIVLPPNNFQMRPLLTIFVITVQIFYASALFGFEHGGSTATMAPRHGGVLVASEEVGAHFELQKLRSSGKLFIYPMDLAQFDPNNFKFSGYLQFGTTRQKQILQIELKDGYYDLIPVKKNNFAVYLNVENTKTKKQDLLRFLF